MISRWWNALFRRRRMEAALDREIEYHLSQRTDELVASGEDRATARRHAERELGNTAQICEDVRATWISRRTDELATDIRHGARRLIRFPGTSLAIILTLAAGTGVNTAIFSVLNGWLLRPLPVPAPEQIAVLAPHELGRRDDLYSYAEYKDIRERSRGAFSSVLAFAFRIAGLSVDGQAGRFVMGAVSGNYFTGLELTPELGRLLRPGEGEGPGEEVHVVLGNAYWKQAFGGDSTIVGKRVRVSGLPGVIVGVAPAGFQGTLFGFPLDGYVTLNAISQDGDPSPWTNRSNRSVNILARMNPGIRVPAAQAAMDIVAGQLSKEYPETNTGVGIRVIPESHARPVALVASFVPAIAATFLFLPALVLAVACLNVAGVILARAESRSREMAVCVSLGGGRGRLIRQLLTETSLLAAIGGAVGIGLGAAALQAIRSYLAARFTSVSNYTISMNTDLDWRVLAYAVLVAVAAGLLCGLWPAVRSARVDINTVLRDTAVTSSSSKWGLRLRQALIVVQVACAIVLVAVSALFAGSVGRAEKTNLGFDADGTLAVGLDAAQIGANEARSWNLYRELTDKFRALPGVTSVGSALTVPMTMLSGSAPVYVEGAPIQKAPVAPSVSFNRADGGYFATLRMPLLEGRMFSPDDGEHETKVAIINQTMAKAFWPGVSAIGKRFSTVGSGGPFVEVVGVLQDGQYQFLSPEPQPYFFRPLSRTSPTGRYLVLRSSRDPLALVPEVEATIRQTQPDLPITNIATMDSIVQGLAGLFFPKLAALLAGLLGSMALAIALLGTYGLGSFEAARRAREYGIRLALGASPGSIVRLAVAKGSRLLLLGLSAGTLVAFAVRRGLAKILFGLQAADVAYIVAAASLAGVLLLAGYLPARRASRANPADIFRSE